MTTGNGWPGADRPTYRAAAPSAAPPTAPPSAPQPTAAASRPVPAGPAGTAQRAATVGPPPNRKGGRRARLVIRRIDPWSVLKFSFVYSLAGLVVLLVATVALYAIVDAMGVIDSIRSFLGSVEANNDGGSIAAWLGFGRIMTIALVLGLVNVVLFTAFATLTAFVYNVCTDLVGGVEVTLADRA